MTLTQVTSAAAAAAASDSGLQSGSSLHGRAVDHSHRYLHHITFVLVTRVCYCRRLSNPYLLVAAMQQSLTEVLSDTR